jgi:hypothetical protein
MKLNIIAVGSQNVDWIYVYWIYWIYVSSTRHQWRAAVPYRAGDPLDSRTNSNFRRSLIKLISCPAKHGACDIITYLPERRRNALENFL